MNEIVIRDLDETVAAQYAESAERFGMTLEDYVKLRLEEGATYGREAFLKAAERCRARSADRPQTDSVEMLRAIRGE